MIGNLKSITFGFTLVFIKSYRANAVYTPSDTPSILFNTSSNFSPFAMRNPVCLQGEFEMLSQMQECKSYLFLDNGPKHVPNVSPTPANPEKVSILAPNNDPILQSK